MDLRQEIERTKAALREGQFTSEASVSQGIILPILAGLGWPVFDTSIVIPEHTVGGRRVDFALCHPAKKPSIFIEVKKVGLTDGADRQLFEYAFHEGIPMAVLTDGQQWDFYLPGEQGKYDERRVYRLDILERGIEESLLRLSRYLAYDDITKGISLKAAREDYENVSKDREILATLPIAWESLIGGRDSLLLELLAEKVEELCGFKPDLDTCSRFFDEQAPSSTSKPQPTKVNAAEGTRTRNKRTDVEPRKRRTSAFEFRCGQKRYKASSARDVMVKVFKLLANDDNSFFERFSARRHGKKRRYLAANKAELYPDRPDLVELASIEIAPGWWLGTNYSRRDIQKIIDLALEVAGQKAAANYSVDVTS